MSPIPRTIQSGSFVLSTPFACYSAAGTRSRRSSATPTRKAVGAHVSNDGDKLRTCSREHSAIYQALNGRLAILCGHQIAYHNSMLSESPKKDDMNKRWLQDFFYANCRLRSRLGTYFLVGCFQGSFFRLLLKNASENLLMILKQ